MSNVKRCRRHEAAAPRRVMRSCSGVTVRRAERKPGIGGISEGKALERRWRSLFDVAFLRHRGALLCRDDPASPVLGVDFGEFSAEVKNLR
jgi:hypothetical protein